MDKVKFRKQQEQDKKNNLPGEVEKLLDGDKAYFIAFASVNNDGSVECKASNNGVQNRMTLQILDALALSVKKATEQEIASRVSQN